MIKIHCIISEDSLARTQWPESLEIRPLIGEYISSVNGRHSRKIVRIEHKYVPRVPMVNEPYSYLVLELSK